MNSLLSYIFSLLNKKYFLLLIFHLFFNMKNSLSISGEYPLAKLLSSGNYLIISEKGIYISHSDFSVNKTIYNFTENEINRFYNYKTVISEFISISNNSYILCLFKGNLLYLFENENFCNKYNLNIESEPELYYNLIPFKLNNLNLQYIISFINGNLDNSNSYKYSIKLFLYEIDLSQRNNNTNKLTKKYEIIKSDEDGSYSIIQDYFISCQKMLFFNKELITCFYHVYDFKSNNNCFRSIYATSFDIINNFSDYISSYYCLTNYIYNLKSSLSLDKKNAFVCLTNFSSYSICLNYNIEQNEFNFINSIWGNKNIETYYFYETNQYILLCYDGYSTNINRNNFKLLFLDNNYRNIKNDVIEISASECLDINLFSLIYSVKNEKYMLISNCKYNSLNYNIRFFTSFFQANYTSYNYNYETYFFINNYSSIIDSFSETTKISEENIISENPLFSLITIPTISFSYSKETTFPSSSIISTSPLIMYNSLTSDNNYISSDSYFSSKNYF